MNNARLYFISFYIWCLSSREKPFFPRFPVSGHILKYMKILDISWLRKGSNIRIVYSLSYYSLATCSDVYYSTSFENKSVIRSLSSMNWNRIVWITLTGKIFLSYNISMRVHDSFMTILCDGNNIPYTILSCNSYQRSLLQRHMAQSHHSVAKMLHLYLLLFICKLCKGFKERQKTYGLTYEGEPLLLSVLKPEFRSAKPYCLQFHQYISQYWNLWLSLIQSHMYFLTWQRLKMTSWLFCFHLALLDYSQNDNIHSLLVHSDSQHCLPSGARCLTEAKLKLKRVI